MVALTAVALMVPLAAAASMAVLTVRATALTAVATWWTLRVRVGSLGLGFALLWGLGLTWGFWAHLGPKGGPVGLRQLGVWRLHS